jgi:predicted lipoprotein with Yx(FWY)xxD motif
MRRLLTPVLAVAALILAAAVVLIINTQGSDDDDDNAAAAAADVTASAAPPSSAPSGPAPAVAVAEVGDLGPVLVDADGMVLYVSDEEAADPDVVCTDACEEFWVPADAGSETATGAPGVSGLDVAERPDGTTQLTHDGLRLYTFSLDSPGDAGGDGLSDTFGGQPFTWHAVVAEETSASGTAATGSNPPEATATTSEDVFDYPGY